MGMILFLSHLKKPLYVVPLDNTRKNSEFAMKCGKKIIFPCSIRKQDFFL